MTVLVARSSTAESAAAVREAVAEARRRGEDLAVFDLDGEPAEGVSPEAATDDLDGVPVRYLGHDLRNHSPAGSLVEAAVALGASVLVIGIKHRSPVGKLLLGSHAQTIILDSPIPVLAVKAPRL